MLEISPPDHAVAFATLGADKEAIDRELGGAPNWTSTDARDYVATERTNVDVGDRAAWPEQHGWLLDQLERYRQVFRDRVARLHQQDGDGDENGHGGSAS